MPRAVSSGWLDGATIERLAGAVIAATGQEYPHVLAQELNSDADLLPPRVLNPSFFGSYDWHSAVHCHWSLVRLLASGLSGDLASEAYAVLDDHLCEERLAGELSFYAGPGGRVAERPYGWAWLVMLHAECARQAQSAEALPGLRGAAARWALALTPLRDLFARRLVEYISSVLAFPVRAGTHQNTAFALQLLLQAAAATRDDELSRAVEEAALRWFAGDPPLAWLSPPSGNDFLDPLLVEVALMADVLDAGSYARWFRQVCPPGVEPDWRPPEFRRDPADPGAVHLEGLVICRAWCLDRLARALAPGEPLASAARDGRDQHLEVVAGTDACAGFSRSHWLPTFLVYLDGWLARDL